MTLPAKASPKPPAQIAPIVEILGLDLTVKFLLAFGGAELSVSDKPRASSHLVGVVGFDNAVALAKINHILQRRVPLAKPWTAARLHFTGMPVAQIARTLHVSDVTVRNYLAKFAPKDIG